MRKALILLICIIGINFLYSADQGIKNGFVQNVTIGKHTITMYAAIHDVPSRSSILPDAKQLEIAKIRRIKKQGIDDVTVNSRPQILDMDPYYGWWGDTFKIYGQGFSKIFASNVLYFDSNAVTANLDSPTTEDELHFGIPAGIRSSFPNVSSSGIGSEEYLNYPFSILAPRDNICHTGIYLPGLISIVSGAKYNFEDYPNTRIYVGYQNNGVPTIAAINLYVQDACSPHITVIDYGDGVAPFLSRVDKYDDYEICYVKKVSEEGVNKKDVYCFTETSLYPTEKAHLHDIGFDPPDVNQFHIKGIASSDKGNYFFVAYYLNNESDFGLVLRVPRGNDPMVSSINGDFGNFNEGELYFNQDRVGIIADTIDDYNNETPGVLVASITGSNSTRAYYIRNGSRIWTQDINSQVFDMETDRRISFPYNPDHPHGIYGIYWYAFGNKGLGTLAEDVVHDVRGFVESFDWDNNSLPNGLRLNTNYISQFKLNTMQDKPVNNQFEIVTSEWPGQQTVIGYPTTEQVQPRFAKITISGWKDRLYYLRVLDPKDLSGYAISNNNPNQDAAPYCKQQGAGGPYLNSCDNQVWSDPDERSDFGLCEDYSENCTPQRQFSIHTNLSTNNPAIGEAILYLKMPGRFNGNPPPQTYYHSAGDNFMLQLSEVDFSHLDWPVNQYCDDSQPWACKMPVDSYSGVYTSWKRVMIERDLLFKHGGLLWDDFDPDCTETDCKRTIHIFPRPWSKIVEGDEVWIFTETQIPSPPPLPDKPAYLTENIAEKRTVVSVNSGCSGSCLDIMLNNDLQNHYYATNADIDNQPQFNDADAHCAGVGVIKRINIDPYDPNDPDGLFDCHNDFQKECFYLSNYDKTLNESYRGLIPRIDNPYDDAYTFVVNPSTYNGAMPYLNTHFPLPPLDELKRWQRFHQHFFEDREPIDIDPTHNEWTWNIRHNYFHLINSGNSLPGGTIGASEYHSDYSFILIGRLIDFCSNVCNQEELNNYINSTAAHELAHQFSVNCWNPPQGCAGHCNNFAWCKDLPGCQTLVPPPLNAPQICVMQAFCPTTEQCTSASIRFDCNELRGGDAPGIPCIGIVAEPSENHIRIQEDPQ